MKILVLLAAVALVGCETKLPSEMSYTEVRQLAEKIVKSCVDQGVKPNTAEMEACVNQEKHREINTRINNREALRDFGNGLQQASANYNRAAHQNRPVTCTSTPIGYTVRTTCH